MKLQGSSGSEARSLRETPAQAIAEIQLSCRQDFWQAIDSLGFLLPQTILDQSAKSGVSE